MQVSTTEDHVSHAVVSGNKTLNMGINASAEFFHILSSSLYTDQRLAVVREVICNAYDAHLDNGAADKPVEITLTNNKLIIRDYGKGIPAEMIAQIYGTYGGSTKKNDGLQTGGFGLGSKAPFAYANHFEVRSFHNGKLTVYRMSKSSAEVGGVPSITPLMTLDTEETGVQVTVDIHSNDMLEFKNKIHDVVVQGGIVADLNGERIVTLPYHLCEHDYIVSRDKVSRLKGDHSIYVKYGNVVYPVPGFDQYRDDRAIVLKALALFNGRGFNNDFSVILLAPPHSISVTPSRESLSMQEKTVKTVSQLLASMVATFKDVQKPEFERQLRKEWRDRVLASGQSWNKVKTENVFETYRVPVEFTNMHDPEVLKAFIVGSATDSRKSALSQKELAKKTLGMLIAKPSPEWDRGLFQRFTKGVRKKHLTFDQYYNRHKNSEWAYRYIIVPMLQQIEAKKKAGSSVRAKNLYVRTSWGSLRELKHMGDLETPHILNLLRRKVILHHTISKAERAHKHEGFDIVYISGNTSQKHINDARECFKDMPILEDNTEDLPVKVKAVASRKKGYPALASVGFHGTLTERAKHTDKRIEKPEFYFEYKADGGTESHWWGVDNDLRRFIFKEFGDLGAAIWTKTQLNAMKAAKVPNVYQYISDWVAQHIDESEGFKSYMENSLHRRFEGHDKWVLDIFESDHVANALGVKIKLDKEDRLLKFMYERMLPHRFDTEALRKTRESISALPFSKTLKTLKPKDNKLLGLLDSEILEGILKAPDPDKKVISFIITALKG